MSGIRRHHPLGPVLVPMGSDAVQGKLLPYVLRRAAADTMLHGGPRLSGLVVPPPTVKITSSTALKVPTLQEERADMEIVYSGVQERMVPLNMHPVTRHELVRLKSEDLYRRAKAEPKFHTPSKDLSILPASRSANGASNKRFMPAFSVKPLVDFAVASPLGRSRGLRSADVRQFQELLNRKGFGEKKNLSTLWNMSREQIGHRPERGY